MREIALSELHTFVVGLASLALGGALIRRVGILQRLTLPAPVVGGLIVAGGVAAARALAGVEVQFAAALRDLLLLVFFTAVGLGAKVSALRAGGRPLAILCAVTVLLLLVQNLVGVGIARLWGSPAFYGLLAGSISFVGGPGTAAAWAKEGVAMGHRFSPEVGIAAATLAVSVGALVAGPISGWLIRRHRLTGRPTDPGATPWAAPASAPAVLPSATSIDQVMHTLLLLFVSVGLGDFLNQWGTGAGVVLPGFLTAMLGGVFITNGADLVGARLEMGPIERGGEIALRSFLAMYLMSLQLWTVGAAITPLSLNVVAQVGVTAFLAVAMLFPLLGRDYDAAVTTAGFLGFGLSSMAVGMATMDQVTTRYGPSPRAFLLVTLAGSFFVDLANALVVKGLLALPLFH
ncbi:MAG TPA: sodium/glutamate symporter [Gemmatimonadales bacterium]|nr:sodium/glutamate symporter [Gemmatimonadales bacterium]